MSQHTETHKARPLGVKKESSPVKAAAKQTTTATSRKTTTPRRLQPTVEQRRAMIAEAAYFIAQRRGFFPGRDQDDWLQAERQIDREFFESVGP